MKIVFVKEYASFEVGHISNVSFQIAAPLIKDGIAEEYKEQIEEEKPKKSAKK